MKTDDFDRNTADIKSYGIDPLAEVKLNVRSPAVSAKDLLADMEGYEREREAYFNRRLMEGALITFKRAVDAATTEEERAYAVRRLELGRSAVAADDFERFLHDCECRVSFVGIHEEEQRASPLHIWPAGAPPRLVKARAKLVSAQEDETCKQSN